MPVDPVEFGRLLSRVEALEKIALEVKQEQKDIKTDIRTILNYFENAKGGWRMLAVIATGAGVAGAGLMKVIHFFPWGK